MLKGRMIEIVPPEHAARATKAAIIENEEGRKSLREPLVSAAIEEKPLKEGVAAIAERYDLTVIVSEVLQAIISHRADGEPLTVDAGIVRVADALDMAKGRSRIPFERGSVSIHSLSAAAIEDIAIMDGEDRPIKIKGWQPENYGHEYFGPVTLTKALALSLNTVSVRLTMEFSPAAVIRTAYRLGIASKLEPNASIALGTSEVSPLELVSAYAPFANGGLAVVPHVIERITAASNGRVLYVRNEQPLGRIIDARYVAMMNEMMQGVTAIGREARPPQIMRERMSRPCWSRPKM
jgi:penicillin-binding protein 1A